MTKLHNYNGRYCETEYENAFLSFLEEAGWNYLPGSSLPRTSCGTCYTSMTWSTF